MGFFEDVLKGAQRLFSKQCPSCGANDADLPKANKIVRRLISQHPHSNPVFEYDSNGKLRQKPEIVWVKDISYQCQICEYAWVEKEESKFREL
jgi:hypothetical protein